MTTKKQKLELTWVGKDKNIKLEPRILIEDPNKSYGDPDSENMLIHGDNLLALKALEQDFTGKIKCIYIDPPYNTGSAFDHYDDNLEHSIWLSLMKPRLEILKNLLRPTDGSIWISIDASESHYLKVLCDEIFGRNNFIDEVIWQRSYAPINLKKTLSRSHDTILVYAKNSNNFELNKIPRSKKQEGMYKNYDNDPRGPWKSDNLSVGPAIEKNIYEIITPSGRRTYPPKGYSWRLSKSRLDEFIKDNRIWFGSDGSNIPSLKRFASEVKEGVTPMTLWTYQEVGHNQDAKKEIKVLFGEDIFDTPKPEKLIQRILILGSNPGDIVLDSFLGSGTTAAVAQKMGRKYIGIEMGAHVDTHCRIRLQKVINGTDGLPLSETLNWKGGGGFKFYNLAPSLLRKDSFGNYVIDEKYNANMLAAAICKHEGFKYDPDEITYWKQGKSTETDYIFVTTGFVTIEQLDSIHAQMTENEGLLICAKSFASECVNHFPNITIKKIPQSILGKCEFGKDNYDLNIISATIDEAEEIEEVSDEQ